jgi:hypothetical protein
VVRLFTLPRPLPPPVEQVASSLFLRVIRVFDLEPSHPRLVRIVQALRDDPLKIVRAHQIEEFASLACDGESFGNDRCTLGQNALQVPPAIAERQAPLVGAAHHTASVKAVLHKAVRAFIDTDLAKNQGVREEFEALRRARRERNGTNIHLIRSDKAC